MPSFFNPARPSMFRQRLTSAWMMTALVWAAVGGPVWLQPVRSAAAADPETVVRCDPANPTTPYTTDVDVNIYVEDVLDLYAADTQLTFDPSLAQVVDAHAGLDGVQIEPLSSFMVPGYVAGRSADNTAGTIRYAATQTNPSEGVNGDGPLARVTFHPLTYGSFTLAFTLAQLGTRDGEDLTLTTQSCLVSFTTPLPTTTGLSPDNALANSAAFTLTVNGTNFIDGSEVAWDGAVRPTTFISSTQVQASIPASDLLEAGPVDVTVVNPAPGGGASNPQTFTVNTHAHFSEAAYSAGESAGSAPIDVVLDAPSSLTVTVAVSSTDGSATLADYGAVSETVTFDPGVVTRTVQVPINADTLDEPDETVLLALSAPSNVLLGTPGAATLTILDDDDLPTVQFASGFYTVTESAGPAPIEVVLSAASGLTVTVTYTSSDLTASAADYTAATGVLTFTPGVTTTAFNVPITSDLIAETDEQVALALGQPANAALGTPASALLTILDDEALPSLAFEQAAYGVTEAGPQVVLTVTLSSQSALLVSVDYASGSGTATAGLDYTPVSGTLSFAPGATTQTITLTVLEDLLDENAETVPVTLADPTNAGLGTPQAATVTLTDNDAAPTVQFASGFYTATEAAGSAPITVTLSAISGLDVTVIYSTTHGTAQALDYTPVSATLTITAGQASGVFNVSVSDDALDENDETLGLSLLLPSNASLGSPASATLTLVDDDNTPTVQFASGFYTATESAGTTPITLTLNAAAALTVTVRFTTTNGTALAGSDYVNASTVITFTPGQTQRIVNITLLPDGTNEADETVLLALGVPENAVLGSPASAVLTIIDDDTAYVVYFPYIRRGP